VHCVTRLQLHGNRTSQCWTDAQKLKLNALIEAMKLMPTISEAEFGNLIGSVGSPPYSFDTGSTFYILKSRLLLRSLGLRCERRFGGVLGGFLHHRPHHQRNPALRDWSTTPARANRTVNHWFDRTDFVPIPSTENGLRQSRKSVQESQ